MLIAVILLSAVPVYLTLDSDIQVQQVLAAQPPSDVNVELIASASTISSTTASSITSHIARYEKSTISSFAPRTSQYLEVTQMPYATVNGKPIGETTLPIYKAYAQFLSYDMTQAAAHMHLYAGRLPEATATGEPVEAMAIPQSGLRVGDVVTAYEFGYHDQVVSVRISGLWYPKDEHDPYWNGRSFKPQIVKDQSPVPPVFPLFLSRDGFFSTLGALNPSPGMEVHVVAYTQPAALRFNDIPQATSNLKALLAHVNGAIAGQDSVEQVAMNTNLNNLLTVLTQQHAISSLPLFIIVAQVVGLALFFVMAMAGMLVESDGGEIAVMRSRGASTVQLVTTIALQGALPALIAALAGPFLAGALSIMLIRLFVTSASVASVQAPSFSQVAVYAANRSAILAALAGAMLGILALATASFQALRKDVLAFRREQGRASSAPFWRRYYLDIVLAGLCVAGYLELGQFGGLTPRLQFSGSGGASSPLLLASPALLLVAGGLITLRLIPVIAAAGMRLATRRRGATGLLAFAQVSRSSSAFLRLTLLLILTVGMAIFALTFQASLAQNARDRAAYQAGGDVSLQLDNSIEGTHAAATIQQQLSHIQGVSALTPLARFNVNGGPGVGATEFTALGIDPATFAHVAYWRSDYASQPLPDLMHEMSLHAGSAQAGESSHPLWAIISQSFADSMKLSPGDLFTFTPEISGQNFVHCVVGAVVQDVPTMYPDGTPGYIVIDLNDFITAFASIPNGTAQMNGPNEFWLRASASHATTAAIQATASNPDLFIRSVTFRQDLQRHFADDPLSTGMTGLLLAGVALAIALAMLGTLVQANAAVSQRLVQFSVLRTLGAGRKELTGVLLREQVLLYLIGILGGTALGALMTTATLPLLAFGSALSDPNTIGIPPYRITVWPFTIALLYAALAIACTLALIWQREITVRTGLGRALRLGED